MKALLPALLSLLLFLPLPTQAKKKPKTEPAKVEKKAPTKYEKLMKDVADSATGGFVNLYKSKKDKVYMEFPKALLGRRMLVGGTISSVSDPSKVNIGYKYSDPTLLKIDLRCDTLVVLTKPSLKGVVSDPELKTAAERNRIDRLYKRIPIEAFNKDSSAVIFDITTILNEMLPKSFVDSKKDVKDGSAYVGTLKTFEDNASVTLHRNAEFKMAFGGSVVSNGDGTLSTNVSFLLLPEDKMKPRLSDSRVGVFSTGDESGRARYDLSQKEDGLKPYYIANRWRIEPTDSAAYLRGEMTTVKKPIVWYIDDSFPADWIEPIRRGVLRWNAAFEKIGLKDVVEARLFPTKEEDPEFDPDNLKYSCLRYIPCNTANAMGPSWVDPETGEIIDASVLVYNDLVQLVNRWRFVQTAQVDPRARAKKMPKELLDESLEYAIAHEVGHTLGLMHNMAASAAYPVDSLRSASFTAQYGTTPSIMDYARFNYVAQPQDKDVKLDPPFLGVYDYYAIDWLYRPVYGAKDPWDEARIASAILEQHDGDPMYRYGEQQVNFPLFGKYDPSARTEDIGDDPIKAGNYGISNLKYIFPNIESWITDDPDYTHRFDLYRQLSNQYYRYLGNVLFQVGGIYLYPSNENSVWTAHRSVPKAVQKASLKWVIDQVKSSQWLNDTPMRERFKLNVPITTLIASNVAYNLLKVVTPNVVVSSLNASKGDEYSVKEFYDDVYNEIFASSLRRAKLSLEEKTLQREAVEIYAKSIIPTKGNSSKGLTTFDFGEDLPRESLFDEPLWECEIGEGRSPYQSEVSISTVSELTGYNAIMIQKILDLSTSLRKSGPSDDRAHYEYLYRMALGALAK